MEWCCDTIVEVDNCGSCGFVGCSSSVVLLVGVVGVLRMGLGVVGVLGVTSDVVSGMVVSDVTLGSLVGVAAVEVDMVGGLVGVAIVKRPSEGDSTLLDDMLSSGATVFIGVTSFGAYGSFAFCAGGVWGVSIWLFDGVDETSAMAMAMAAAAARFVAAVGDGIVVVLVVVEEGEIIGCGCDSGCGTGVDTGTVAVKNSRKMMRRSLPLEMTTWRLLSCFLSPRTLLRTSPLFLLSLPLPLPLP